LPSARRRATNCILSSIAEHSFQGISPFLKPGGSVTHVFGTMCFGGKHFSTVLHSIIKIEAMRRTDEALNS